MCLYEVLGEHYTSWLSVNVVSDVSVCVFVYSCVYVYIYMVRFKAREQFMGSTKKKKYFEEVTV